jgi:RHS repeat-associated protein
VNEHAEVVLERDVLGRVIKETCNGETVESKYDIADNRIKITSSLGADLEAGYNLMGDVVSLATEGWQTGYERDVFGLETARRMDGGLLSHAERDSRGRVVSNKLEKNNRYLSEKSYLWGLNDKLLSSIIDGKETRYEYDGWGNLSKTLFEDGKAEYRNPDRSGNLFESLDRMDRKYAKGGQLVKTENWEYKYDREGNLIRKKDKHGATWRYEWNAAGMLASVKRPDAQEVTFKYDALGRRIEKRFGRRVTTWYWDGNVPLHEKTETITPDYSEERGHFDDIRTQPVVTWVFEEGTFVPAAKITEKQKFSIVTNYMGTPEAMYREDGEKVWTCELNSYGKVRNFQGESKTMCNWRFQGQYEDSETGLYYNRFRYYSPDEGIYLSQDPIGLRGGHTLYSYVKNPNGWLDLMGLKGCEVKEGDGTTHDIVLEISKKEYPETAQHIEDAINAGKPDIVTIGRLNASQRRAESLKGTPTEKGKDRDEWPMAMFKEGGAGADIKQIDPKDNRGAGSSIGSALSGYSEDTKVKIVIVSSSTKLV